MFTKGSDCEICAKVKIRRSPHARRLPLSCTPFHRLHTDVLQINPVSKLSYRYVLVIIDDASRFNRVYLLKSKSESEHRLLEFFAKIKTKTNITPSYLHSDRGGEFSLSSFLDKLKTLGVSIERGPANSPQTNGIVERFNGILLDKIKCMMLQSQVPLSMWHEAVCHASTILNVLPHASLNWISPTSVLAKHNLLLEPDRTTSPLIPFGAKVVVHRSNPIKLSPKGIDHWFVGFEPYSDAARFLDPIHHRIVISRDYLVPKIQINPNQTKSFKDIMTLPRAVSSNVEGSLTSVKLPIPISKSTSSKVQTSVASPEPNRINSQEADCGDDHIHSGSNSQD